jgi:hypothetical protein
MNTKKQAASAEALDKIERLIGEYRRDRCHYANYMCEAAVTRVLEELKRQLATPDEETRGPAIRIDEGRDLVTITTAGGKKFEIAVKDDKISVTSATNFGSGLVIEPTTHGTVHIKQN